MNGIKTPMHHVKSLNAILDQAIYYYGVCICVDVRSCSCPTSNLPSCWHKFASHIASGVLGACEWCVTTLSLPQTPCSVALPEFGMGRGRACSRTNHIFTTTTTSATATCAREHPPSSSPPSTMPTTPNDGRHALTQITSVSNARVQQHQQSRCGGSGGGDAGDNNASNCIHTGVLGACENLHGPSPPRLLLLLACRYKYITFIST